jgi:hypothetical protein
VSAIRIVAVIGGIVVVAAAAGGGAYFALKDKGTTSKPVEAPVATASPSTLPDDAKNGSTSMVDLPKVLTFEHLNAKFSIAKPTAAYVGASHEAPQMYSLPPGTPILAIEQSTDKQWVIAPTEDGQAAYLPTSDLGPFQPDAQQAIPVLAETVTGVATVIDTATLSIDGQNIPLFGVAGETGDVAVKLQKQIDALGSTVTCQLQGDSYICMLPKDVDVARIALYNGAARPGPDATPDYQAQADAAKAAHKGIWQ